MAEDLDTREEDDVDDEETSPKVKPSIVGADGAIRFDLELESIPVFLTDPETKEEQEYILRELNGKERDLYLNTLTGRIKSKKGQEASINNFTGLQSSLVRKCLFRVEPDRSETTLTEDFIQSMPAKVQTAIHDQAKTMSGLDDEAEKTAKND